MDFIASCILILFSGYFITSLTYSPIYFSFLIGLLFVVFLVFKQHTIWADKSTKIVLLFLSYIVITQYILNKNSSHAVFNVVFSLLHFCVICRSLLYCDRYQIQKLSRWMINVSIPLVIYEGIYRWQHPIVYINNVRYHIEYYQYKYSSIMYGDSNYVGLFCVCLFFFCVYLEKNEQLNLKIQKIILAIAIIGTLSKASIATLIVFYIMFDVKAKLWIRMCIMGVGVMVGLSDFVAIILRDGSFVGKISIIKRTYLFLKAAPIKMILFGVGFGNTNMYIPGGAHNLIATYIVESGVVGLFLLFWIWYNVLKITKYKLYVVLLPFFVNCMSLSGHANTYFYTILAIATMLEKRREEEGCGEENSAISRGIR